jgi:hypothetical protein
MLIPLALSMANAAVRVTATDVRNDLFKATSEGVAIPIEAREVTLSATYPSGKDEPAKLAVLFEPKSHLYLWEFYSAPRFGKFEDLRVLDNMTWNSAYGIGNGRLVDFAMPGEMSVRDSTERAADMDDAERRALHESDLQLATFDTAPQMKTILVGKKIATTDLALDPSGRTSFLAPPNRSDPGPYPVHVQAAYIDGKWEVLLEAQFKVKVVLDNNYQVLKVERIVEASKEQSK